VRAQERRPLSECLFINHIAGAMREWVDRNNCWLERFETEAGDGGGVIIKAQFTEDDLAELFRCAFRGNYGE
jgi:hypothetical protein